MKTKFIVVDEDKFGYVDPRQPNLMCCLASKAGASHSWKDGMYVIPYDSNRVRPATLADFERFRILFSQWPPTEYELPIT